MESDKSTLYGAIEAADILRHAAAVAARAEAAERDAETLREAVRLQADVLHALGFDPTQPAVSLPIPGGMQFPLRGDVTKRYWNPSWRAKYAASIQQERSHGAE